MMRARLGIAAVVAVALVVASAGAASATPGPDNPGKRVAVGRAKALDGATGCSSGATCIPGGTAVIEYTVTGTGSCYFTANINWADPWQPGTQTYTFTAATTFSHHYSLPGTYTVAVSGSGYSTDPNTACTFSPTIATFEVPQQNFLQGLSVGALQLYSKLSESVSAATAASYAAFFDLLGKAMNLFNFGKSIDDFKNYNDYVLARNDAFYNTAAGRGNLDLVATQIAGCPNGYQSCTKEQKLQIGKLPSIANQTGASGDLIQMTRKAAQAGVVLEFQLP